MLSAVMGTKRPLRAADKSQICIVTIISTRQEDRHTAAHKSAAKQQNNSDVLARVHVSFQFLNKLIHMCTNR